MAPLGYQQTMQVWVNACGSNAACVAAAPVAAAITFPESGNDPSVVQKGQPYATTGWGLWQITPGNSEPQFGIDQALLDPQANANAAVAKWEGAGGKFTPWTTYTGGQYRAYLQSGASIPSASASSSPSTSSGTSQGSSSGSYGIGSFGSTLGKAITGAESDAANTGLGLVLVLGGALALLVAVWLLLPQGIKDTLKAVPRDAVRLAVVMPK